MLRIRRRPFAAGMVLAAVLLLAATPTTAEERQPEVTLATQLWEWIGSLWRDPAAPSAPDTMGGSTDPLRQVRDKGGEIDPNG